MARIQNNLRMQSLKIKKNVSLRLTLVLRNSGHQINEGLPVLHFQLCLHDWRGRCTAQWMDG